MKSKPIKKPDHELEQDEDESMEENVAEVDSGAPGVASAKKSKLMIIAASSVFITVVLYFFFFRGNDNNEKLEVVETPRPSAVAPSDNGKSPFELEIPQEEKKDEVELLKTPATPEIPTLPELPKEALLPEEIPLAPQQNPSTLPLSPDQKPQEQQASSSAAQQQGVQPAQEIPAAAQKEVDPRYSPIIVFSGVVDGGGPARSVGYDDNIVKLNQNPIDNLKKSKVNVTATYIADRQHTIAQGKLFSAVLETAINTELPGSVRAIISRDVYGESGNQVLIPKGSRLFGAYSSQIIRGQGRVQIGWTRLIRPDGVDLAISFNASDQFGRSGLAGDVDNRYSALITNSLLTSVLAVGGVAAAQKLLTNNNTTTTTTNPTQGTTTTTGSAANQALYDVSKTIIDTVGQVLGSGINVTPVIRVPQGTKITVIVNSDINVPSMVTN